MSDLNYLPVVLFTGASAKTGTAYKCNYRYNDNHGRTVHVVKTSGDVITIEGSLDNGTTWGTIMTCTSAQTNQMGIFAGPFTDVRAKKTGTAGTATVKAVV